LREDLALQERTHAGRGDRLGVQSGRRSMTRAALNSRTE
jgi:hypothetical protein